MRERFRFSYFLLQTFFSLFEECGVHVFDDGFERVLRVDLLLLRVSTLFRKVVTCLTGLGVHRKYISTDVIWNPQLLLLMMLVMLRVMIFKVINAFLMCLGVNVHQRATLGRSFLQVVSERWRCVSLHRE